MVLTVTCGVAPLLPGTRTQIEVTEKRTRLRRNTCIEIHHGPVGTRVPADDAMRIVASGACHAVMVAVRTLVTHGRQVVALAAKSRRRCASPPAPAAD